MSQIKVNITITNQENTSSYISNAIKIDNIIKYQEEDNTIVVFDINNNKLSRENKDLKMEYYFDRYKATKGLLEIKDLNRNIELDIITNNIIKDDNNIEINFQIDNNNFKYKLEVIG